MGIPSSMPSLQKPYRRTLLRITNALQRNLASYFIFISAIALCSLFLHQIEQYAPSEQRHKLKSRSTCNKRALFDERALINAGSTERLHRLLHKASAGLPTSIAVLGGSVSSCHGLEGSTELPFGNPLSENGYPHRLYDFWTETFPSGSHELINGAARRTDASYFAYCSSQHLPDNVDMIIVELDGENDSTLETTEHMEILIRSLLLRKEAPAVLLLGHFSPDSHLRQGYFGADVYHNAIARYYGIPYLSTKPLLHLEYMKDSSAFMKEYYIDASLPNAAGQKVLADTLTGYFNHELCKLSKESSKEQVKVKVPLSIGHVDKATLAKSSDLPPLLNSRPADLYRRKPSIVPYCTSASDRITPMHPHLSKDWKLVDDNKKSEIWQNYWYTETAGARLRVPIQTSAGDVGIYHYVVSESEAGMARCWVDDNESGAVLINGFAEEQRAKLTMIDHNVAAGAHSVECEIVTQSSTSNQGVQQGNQFRVYAVFAT